ncbi:MAG: portal protein [Lysobacteraceae bacterium SCN 69-48]|nr:MAG: portal protein [Xanthomonadaceae bacterium SCN 69-48]
MNDLTNTPRPVLNREIATTRDGIDITRGYTGPLLQPFDSVLRNRGGDLAIYEQVRSDEEVKAAFGQRQSAVVQCEFRVDAGGERRKDKQAAEWLQQQLQKLRWDNTTEKMLFGVFYGYAVAELIYGVDEGKIGISAIKVRNRRRFRYGKDGDLRLLTQASMFEGIPCERPYFWDFCCGADHDDEPYGLGLAHWLYWPVLFKRNGIKFWLTFLEKFGMPTGLGKYPNEATPAEKQALLSATRAIHQDSGVIIPTGMELELIEAARSGTADYKTLHDTMNAAIQKVTLGQTASTQGTPGKLGNEDLQGDVRDDIIKADADLVCESFNQQIVPQLMAWNFPDAELPRVWRVTEEDEDLNTAAERDDKIQRWGFKPTLKYVQDKYGGEWVEREQPQQLQPGEAGTPSAIAGAEFADPGRAVAQLLRRHGAHFAEGEDAIEVRMGRQLDVRVNPTGKRWNDQVRALVDKAADFAELESGLLALAADMELDDYAQAFAEAMTAAHLAGRYELMQR